MTGTYPNRAAQKLAAFRKANSWTQADLAAALGCSRIAIARLETGLTHGPRWKLNRKLQELGVCEPGDWLAEPVEASAVAEAVG